MPLAVCATPIGNLDDVTLRVLAELREADVVLAEDTRHTRGLLERHGIAARLLSYHEHNEAARVAELAAAARGRRADRARLGCGHAGRLRSRARGSCGRRSTRASPVTVLPGPSAVETALVASGLVGGRTRSSASCRARRASSLRSGASSRRGRWPVVAFESPQRLPASLRSLAAVDPEREVAVCRELTKRFEEVVRGTAAELAERFAEPPKGEITLVVGAGGGAAVATSEPARWRRSRSSSPPERRGGVAAEVVARLTACRAKRPLPRLSVTTL